MRIDGARVAEEVIAPDAGKDLLAVKDAARMAGKQVQKLHLARRAGDVLPVHAHAVALVLDFQAPVGQRGELILMGVLAAGGGAPQDGLDAGDDLARGEGLDDVVVRTHFKAENAVDLLAPGGEHDDGQAAFPADGLADLHAGCAGHHLVQEHQVVVLLFHHFKCLLAVVSGVVQKVFVVKIQRKRLVDDRVVVANQNAHVFVHGRSPLACSIAYGCDGIVSGKQKNIRIR